MNSLVQQSEKNHTENRKACNDDFRLSFQINVIEYRCNRKCTIQRNRQHKTKKKKNHNKISVEHHYTQTNTNNVNTTLSLLQTTGGKEEPNIFIYAEIVTDSTTRNSEGKKKTKKKQIKRLSMYEKLDRDEQLCLCLMRLHCGYSSPF